MTHRPILYFARAVVEAVTPLSVSTGSPDNVFDTALVRDANALPAIPGTAIAGVLRHLWIDAFGVPSADKLFGYQHKNSGQPSRLALTWGALLDSRGQTAEGLLAGSHALRLDDPLFASALARIDEPLFRNRVRIGHRGAASDTGKFDRAILAAGNRFAFELRLWSAQEGNDSDWDKLLALLVHPGFRLGGATRAGLGSLRLVALHRACFDLRAPDQAKSFCKLGRGLTDFAGLSPHQPTASTADWLTGTLTLTARGFWRIGQGDRDLMIRDNDCTGRKPPDLLPVTEERVEWTDAGGRPQVRHMLLLPATSLKGALAHRMSFHARRFVGEWAAASFPANEPPKPATVETLLGEVSSQDSGRAGCLYLDDAFLPIEEIPNANLTHNSIDRFTGGVRDRVLYEEQSLHGGTFKIQLTLDLKRLRARGGTEAVRKALSATLADLNEGRLAIGSRTTAGNGFFNGGLDGTLADWLQGEALAAEPMASECV